MLDSVHRPLVSGFEMRPDASGRLVRIALMTAAGALLLTGCASKRGGPIPYGVEDFGPPDAPSTYALDEAYEIAPMDKLSITVFQVPDLSGEFDVDLRGHISFPLLGSVRAIDLTPDELESTLTAALAENYLRDPDVTVGITSSTRRNVTVDGAVRDPGLYPITGPTTLMQAIAMASGSNEDANLRRIAIFRQIDGQRTAAAFDLTSIRRGEMADPEVYSGDIIVVDGTALNSTTREILRTLPLIAIFHPVL